MAKKKLKHDLRETALMIVYWAIFLTATMAFFERYNIHPATVPYGPIGWTIFVELPRVALGFLISLLIVKALRK